MGERQAKLAHHPGLEQLIAAIAPGSSSATLPTSADSKYDRTISKSDSAPLICSLAVELEILRQTAPEPAQPR